MGSDLMDQKTREAAEILAEYFSKSQKRLDAMEREIRKEKEALFALEKRVRKIERGDAT